MSILMEGAYLAILKDTGKFMNYMNSDTRMG